MKRPPNTITTVSHLSNYFNYTKKHVNPSDYKYLKDVCTVISVVAKTYANLKMTSEIGIFRRLNVVRA